MIAYLKGIIDIKRQDYVVIDVHGVGYKIFMPEGAIQNLEVDSEAKIYTFMRVREDDVSLYGFLNVEELAMFELLISVGGIGAKSAVGILSNIAPSKFALAVITDDVTTLKKLPGIGAKTAQRIILELKDKIKTQEATEQENEIKQKTEVSDSAKDAIEALQVLGYTRREVEEAISKIGESNLTTEEIIKQGLKYLGR
ncbi:holliday junction ATP-dependent DNA helicase RuvA [Clostridium sp. CAG:793]|nr:holliday junction ATP-dependent DNA helicase RuvA [Clostridium sp. CAG:793]